MKYKEAPFKIIVKDGNVILDFFPDINFETSNSLCKIEILLKSSAITILFANNKIWMASNITEMVKLRYFTCKKVN